MASITGNDSGASNADDQGTAPYESKRGGALVPALNSLPAMYKWGAGLALIAIVLVACLAIWGPGMEYPTTVATTEVPTGGGNTIFLEKTLRQQTGSGIDAAVNWLTLSGDWLFDGISIAVTYALLYIEDILKWIPWPALVVALTLLAFAMGRWTLAGFTALALLYIGFMDLWQNTIDTIALMVVAVAVAMAIGLPLGVLGARSRVADNLMRPVLDGMQTMPSFVYLLPGILFFGLGKPAGIFATIIYAVPPVIRLTNLGIRQVSPETVEAARSFGASPMQVLTKVQIPMALPTIMAGINQTTMMALAMVTIASMGGGRRSGRQCSPGPAEERIRQRSNRRFGHRFPGHPDRQTNSIRCPQSTGIYGYWLVLQSQIYSVRMSPQ